MSELLTKILGFSFGEILILLFALVFLVIILLFSFSLALDRLDIKSFSLRNGITFYEDGAEKKSRITGRKKTVRRKTR